MVYVGCELAGTNGYNSVIRYFNERAGRGVRFCHDPTTYGDDYTDLRGFVFAGVFVSGVARALATYLQDGNGSTLTCNFGLVRGIVYGTIGAR